MKFRFLGFLLCACFVCVVSEGAVDTLKVRSAVMNKDIDVIVVTSENYDRNDEAYPVVYMLHGYNGNYIGWYHLKPDLQETATRDRIIFVSPSGENSWYLDSPVDPSSCYDTFVSKELVRYVDGNYRTIDNRTGRAITGLSMGGHGAFYLAFTHPDVYGAAGSTSGALDIRSLANNGMLNKLIGDYNAETNNWDKWTVMTKVENLKNGEFALIFDCGNDDGFLKVNNDMHRKLLEHKIDHDYIVRPGGHNGPYWSNAINYHILFFKKYFDRYR